MEATSWPWAVFVQSAMALSRLAPLQKRARNGASLQKWVGSERKEEVDREGGFPSRLTACSPRPGSLIWWAAAGKKWLCLSCRQKHRTHLARL